jgi:YidC/Oxa1 family membrane protein insertase
VAIRWHHPPDSAGIIVKDIFSIKEVDDEELTPANLVLTFDQGNQALLGRLMPRETTTISFEIVVAPKQWDQLSLIKPALDRVVLINLWDWFRWICFAIWQLFNFLFDLSGSWGNAIILMALVVRILIIPVTRVALRHQERAILQQARIKPLLQKVREEYKGIDLSQQMVTLYEKEKYDHLAPFKGMLGLFIQIPILIALFNVLGEAPELNGVPFLWFNDLSLSDRLFPLGVDLPFFGAYFNLLPFLMAGITVLSTYYAARSSGSTNVPTSSLLGMATIFFLLFYSFPSALVLYWLCSNCFQFLQQVIENIGKSVRRQTDFDQ